jgi:hypothetical protein
MRTAKRRTTTTLTFFSSFFMLWHNITLSGRTVFPTTDCVTDDKYRSCKRHTFFYFIYINRCQCNRVQVFIFVIIYPYNFNQSQEILLLLRLFLQVYPFKQLIFLSLNDFIFLFKHSRKKNHKILSICIC